MRVIRNIFVIALCLMIVSPWLISLAQAQVATEAQIRAAILEEIDPVLASMDRNGDGIIDVADLVSLMRTAVGFVSAESVAYENGGTIDIELLVEETINATINYTVGGSATPGTDFTALPGSVTINGTSCSIPVELISDTILDDNETIVISLLPSSGYPLGTIRRHTITLHDNPTETTATYRFALATETQGVSGSTTDGTGFPPSLLARAASIDITFSETAILDAVLDIAKSTGISSGTGTIPANSVSADGGKITMIFEYTTQSESFVSDPSITSFDASSPSLGTQTKKTLQNTLTLTIDSFTIETDKFTKKVLQGEFSLVITGVFKDGTQSFYTGTLVGKMQ